MASASTFSAIELHRRQQKQQQQKQQPSDCSLEPDLSGCVRWTNSRSLLAASNESLAALLDLSNWPILDSSYSTTAGPWNIHYSTSPPELLSSPSTATAAPSSATASNRPECWKYVKLHPVYEMDGTCLYDREDWPLRGPPRHRSVSPVRPGEQNIPEHLVRRAASTRVGYKDQGQRHKSRMPSSHTPHNSLAHAAFTQEEEDDLVISDIDDDSDQARAVKNQDNRRDAGIVHRSAHVNSPAMLTNGQIVGSSQAQRGHYRTPSSSPPRSDISSSPVLASPQRHRDSIASNNRSAASPQPHTVHASPSRRSIDQYSHSRQQSQTNGHAQINGFAHTHGGNDHLANHSRNGSGAPNGDFNSFLPANGPPPFTQSSTNPRRLSQHMSFSRDRVRYSWQSAQTEDDPNRPRIHIVKLISNTTSASAGFPGGEALSFSISPGGRRIAAFNSARLYVLQTAALPVGISQDYALKRRPLSVEVLDEGEVMAVLVDAHTCNVYGLGHHRLRLRRTIKFDFPASCIALSPTGGLLAAGYEGGVEVFSLDPDALPTDRRAVRSQKMDRLMFSDDSSTLLGTTTRINASATVMISVPVFPSASNGIPTHSELREAWCNELLHPENIRNSSHASFMRSKRSTVNDRVFAWNGLADTFGILNTHDMQYGNTDFPVVISPPLSTCGGLGAAIHSCPAVDEFGDTIAMVVNDRTIRLYLNPQGIAGVDLETVEAHSIDHELDEGYGQPFSEVRWLTSAASLPAPASDSMMAKGRLVITSPGGVMGAKFQSEEMFDEVEGGRIILFDFDPQFAGQPGQTFSLTLGSSPPQMLEEASIDVATEVAIVRRRTVNQSKSGTLNQRPIPLGRSASQFGGRQRGRMDGPGVGIGMGPPNSRRSINIQPVNVSSEALATLHDLQETQSAGSGVEPFEAVDEPYAQNAPRSHASMQRAATNAQRHRYQAIEERSQEQLGEHLNVEDRNIPLPEYTQEPNAPLPSRYRALAGLDGPAQPSYDKPQTTTSGEDSDTDLYRSATPPASYQQNHAPLPPVDRPESGHDLSMMRPSFSTSGSGFNEGYGLNRAYSTAVHGSSPRLTGDWRAAQGSPVSALTYNRDSTIPNGLDVVSPLRTSPPRNWQQPGSIPTRAHTTSFGQSSAGARVPPHVLAIRNAAAAAATSSANSSMSASMFPSAHAPDLVPHPQTSQPADSVSHPVTDWQAPTSSHSAPSDDGNNRLRRAQSDRNHLRKSDPRNSSSRESQKKMKFSKNKAKSQLFNPPDPSAEDTRHSRGPSRLETRSMFTTKTKRDRKCVMM